MNKTVLMELVRVRRDFMVTDEDEETVTAGQRLLDEIEKAQFIARLASDEDDTSRLIMLTGILSDYCNRVTLTEEDFRRAVQCTDLT